MADLLDIRQVFIGNNIDVQDLQFLVDNNKKVFINDPLIVETLNPGDPIGAVGDINRIMYEIITRKIQSYTSSSQIDVNEIINDVLQNSVFSDFINNVYIVEGTTKINPNTGISYMSLNGGVLTLNF